MIGGKLALIRALGAALTALDDAAHAAGSSSNEEDRQLEKDIDAISTQVREMRTSLEAVAS